MNPSNHYATLLVDHYHLYTPHIDIVQPWLKLARALAQALATIKAHAKYALVRILHEPSCLLGAARVQRRWEAHERWALGAQMMGQGRADRKAMHCSSELITFAQCGQEGVRIRFHGLERRN